MHLIQVQAVRRRHLRQRKQLVQKRIKIGKDFIKMGKYFGTDGVRGEANVELTPELAFKLGRFGDMFLANMKRKHRKFL